MIRRLVRRAFRHRFQRKLFRIEKWRCAFCGKLTNDLAYCVHMAEGDAKVHMERVYDHYDLTFGDHI